MFQASQHNALRNAVATLFGWSWKILSYLVANLSKTLHTNFCQNQSSIVEIITKWYVFMHHSVEGQSDRKRPPTLSFSRATACNAIARLCYGKGVLPSVWCRLSVILKYCVKTTNWGSWNLHCVIAYIESLVSNEVIWCRWVRRFPSNEGIKEGYPP